MKFTIYKKVKKILKMIPEILVKLDALDASITAEKQQYASTITTLNDQLAVKDQQLAAKDQAIADLQSQLAAAVDPAALNNIEARITDAATAVGSIVP